MKAFKALFHETARYRHRHEVFRDFVTMSAIGISNAVDPTGERLARESEYLQITQRYTPEDIDRHCRLLALVVEGLQPAPEDFLGRLYMDLELGDAHRGQFYTPHGVSKMMAEMQFSYLPEQLAKTPFVTVSDPACGAGGMLLPVVEILQRSGHDPARHLWIQAVDIDRVSALMCYIQLTLWNVPAEVIVGDTLRLEIRESWYTPAYELNGWRERLRRAGLGPGFIGS